jgi:hypothetical protein
MYAWYVIEQYGRINTLNQRQLSNSRSVGIFLLTPALAMALGIGIYVHGARSGVDRRRLPTSVWHVSALTLVLVCMVIAPSAAFFRLALSSEFAKLISTERAWIEAQEADVLRATEIEAIEDHYSPAARTELLLARRDHFSCVPTPYDAEVPVLHDASPSTRLENVRRDRLSDIPAALPVGTRGSLDDSSVVCATRTDGSPVPPAHTGAVRPIGLDAMVLDALQWRLADVLPIENDIISRQRFQAAGFTYSPSGTWLSPMRASGVAVVGLGLTLALLVSWIRWNTTRLFLANEEANASAIPPAEPLEDVWKSRTADEQLVLLQVARERIVNPHQRPVVKRLLKDGLLTLNPDLQPSSTRFDEFLQNKERDLLGQLREWERVNVGHSWRYVRLVLVASATGLAGFLLLTQPGLQSSLLGIATGITGALTAGLKLRDAVASWFERKSA